jgi:secretion/DNA translocation related CpaE-like protein
VAATVLIADDQAGRVAAQAFPVREGVYLVGSDDEVLARWSAPLGARVIPLPGGVAWLGVVLAGSAAARAPVVAVIGGSGGVGASTAAATLACLGAARPGAAALVDTDPLGGGIDLLLGAERQAGWRWPRLSGADGHVGELRRYLPVVDGVSLVSMARGPALDLAREPLAAIVGSLCREHALVVLDPGRGLGAAGREAIRLAGWRVLVVAGSVRGLASARETIRALQLERVVAVVRPGRAGLGAGQVADALELEVVGTRRCGQGGPIAAAARRCCGTSCGGRSERVDAAGGRARLPRLPRSGRRPGGGRHGPAQPRQARERGCRPGNGGCAAARQRRRRSAGGPARPAGGD